jgi:hypothetical protein
MFWKQVSAVYVVQYPDAAGTLRGCHHQLFPRQRQPNCGYDASDHQAGIVKLCDLKNITDRLSPRRIEAHSKHVEISTALREKVDRPPIRRPSRLVVPVPALGHVNPLPARNRRHFDTGFKPPRHAMTVRYSHLAPAHTLAAVERLACNSPAQPTGTRTSTVVNLSASANLGGMQ